MTEPIGTPNTAESTPSAANFLPLLVSAITTVTKFASVVGGIVVGGYLVFGLRFVPSGLGLADSLLLIAAAILFGMVYVLTIGVLPLIYVVLTTTMKEHISNKVMAIALGIVAGIALVMGIFFVAGFHRSEDDSTLNVGVVVTLFISLRFIAPLWDLVLTESDRDETAIADPWADVQRKYAVGLAIVGAFLPAIATVAFGERLVTLHVMSRLGVYTESASVYLQNTALDLATRQAREHMLPVFHCDGGPAGRLIADIRVLWHGHGDRSLLELRGGPPDQLVAFARIDVPRADIGLVRQENPSDIWTGKDGSIGQLRCIEVDAWTFFTSPIAKQASAVGGAQISARSSHPTSDGDYINGDAVGAICRRVEEFANGRRFGGVQRVTVVGSHPHSTLENRESARLKLIECLQRVLHRREPEVLPMLEFRDAAS